jgi:hypothetical protein
MAAQVQEVNQESTGKPGSAPTPQISTEDTTSVHLFADTMATRLAITVDKGGDGTAVIPTHLLKAYLDAMDALEGAQNAILMHVKVNKGRLPYPFSQQYDVHDTPTMLKKRGHKIPPPPWMLGEEIFEEDGTPELEPETYGMMTSLDNDKVYLTVGHGSPELVTRRAAHDYIERLPRYIAYTIADTDSDQGHIITSRGWNEDGPVDLEIPPEDVPMNLPEINDVPVRAEQDETDDAVPALRPARYMTEEQNVQPRRRLWRRRNDEYTPQEAAKRNGDPYDGPTVQVNALPANHELSPAEQMRNALRGDHQIFAD